MCYIVDTEHLLNCLLVFGFNFFVTNTFSVQQTYIQQSVAKKDLEKASRNLSTIYKISGYLFNLLVGWLMLQVVHVAVLLVGVVGYVVSSIFFLKLKASSPPAVVSEKQQTLPQTFQKTVCGQAFAIFSEVLL